MDTGSPWHYLFVCRGNPTSIAAFVHHTQEIIIMNRRNLIVPFLIAFLGACALPSWAAGPEDDQEFVLKAGHGGHAEVKAGNLAKTKASDAGVRQFGEMMVTDHTKAGKELEAAAKAAGLSYPVDTDAKHKEMLDKLMKLNGADFDKAYIADMVDGHQAMEKLLESMAKDAKAPQLQNWAKNTLPAVKSHLKRAEEIKKSLP
jgi:putative membrane protein